MSDTAEDPVVGPILKRLQERDALNAATLDRLEQVSERLAALENRPVSQETPGGGAHSSPRPAEAMATPRLNEAQLDRLIDRMGRQEKVLDSYVYKNI